MIVVDTGVLLAAADADDHYHDQAAAFLDGHEPDELVVPATVATETSWMTEDRLDPAAAAAFIASIADGDLHVVELTLSDYGRCAQPVDAYADLGLGLVDASVVAVAERLGVTTVATFNHRHFRVVRRCRAAVSLPRLRTGPLTCAVDRGRGGRRRRTDGTPVVMTAAVLDAPHSLVPGHVTTPSAPVTNGGDRFEVLVDRCRQRRGHRREVEGRGPKPVFGPSR